MGNDYQLVIDDLFGSNYKHRTLRTVFDPNSTEWLETNVDEKISILRRILDSNRITLKDLIFPHKIYYTHGLENKRHVINSIEDSLTVLLSKLL